MGVLNFNTDNLITGVNIIDGNLYWTDNNSEPKKLEIDRFRDYDHTGVATSIRGDLVIESDLSVIRLHPWKPITLNLTEYTPTDTQPEPPFESIFPRFSYRWRYEDGQYSPFAPFTQAAFLPQSRTDAAMVETENYTEGFNTTLFNNVGQIDLQNIPRGPRDVVAVDLLYTESISSTIYVLETIEIPEAQRGLDFVLSSSYTTGEPTVANGDYSLLPLSYSISARKVYRALPANQLLRPYDEVPQRALAQEITANRLIYGNYQIGFDQPDALTLDAEFISAGTGDGLHVKGNRTYEIGVAYIDPYGRQGSMVTAGSIILDDGTVDEQIPLQSPFSQSTRQQIRATITSDPPTWADRYRYFIKDPSMDFHNLICYNIYNDGSNQDTDSEFIWLEFQSTDRNKVFDETSAVDGGTATVLVLRRINDTVSTEKQRFLVQDIENEAPDDVRNQITTTVSNTEATRLGQVPHQRFREWGGNPWTSTQINLTDASDGIDWQITLDAFNSYLRNNGFPVILRSNDDQPLDPIDLLMDGDDAQPLLIRFNNDQDSYVQATRFQLNRVDGNTRFNNELVISFGNRFTIDEDSGEVTDTGMQGFARVPDGGDSLELFTTGVSEEAISRLAGRFWVKAARNGLSTQQSEFTFDGELVGLSQLWFETEPAVAASQLDLFWGTSDTFCVCTEHGWANDIDWYNCMAEVANGGVYLESTRINNKFNTVQLVRGVMANTPTDRNAVIDRPYGLTWSGIYNSRTSVNRLNQFITEDGITKELEPNYGSLQKLHTRDTNLIAICEDKVFRIQADKDQLFNADGSSNVTASNAVLGQTIPVIGEYGISTNPESFASYGHNVWFSDAKRGVMLQYTPGNGQIFEISERGFNDFFRDRLFSANNIIGMYDDYSDAYIVSIQGYDTTDAIIADADLLPSETTRVTDANVTLKYETSVEGWPSFLSFVPEAGLTLNNKFYTFKDGQVWMHNSNTSDRNNFYGDQFDSEIQVIFNDNPSVFKEYQTLSYEGSADWNVITVDTENFDPVISGEGNFPFMLKEGKYHRPIVSTEDVYAIMDPQPDPVPDDALLADDGTTVLEIIGTRERGGIKGFFNNVTFRNSETEMAELFAINTETYVSSN